MNRHAGTKKLCSAALALAMALCVLWLGPMPANAEETPSLTEAYAMFFPRDGVGSADVQTTLLNQGAYALEITRGGNPLTAGTDYVVSGDTVTFQNAYLRTLPTGDNVFEFLLVDAGFDPLEFTIHVVEDIFAYLTPASATFYKSGTLYADVQTTLMPDSNSKPLESITLSGTALTAGSDYTVSGDTYTFKKEYLGTLAAGQHVFTFNIGQGYDYSHPTFTITVEEGSPAPVPEQQDDVYYALTLVNCILYEEDTPNRGSSFRVAAGTKLTLHAPQTTSLFSGWHSNGGAFSYHDQMYLASPYIYFTMPSANAIVTAVYEEDTTFDNVPLYRTMTDPATGVSVAGLLGSDARLRVEPLIIQSTSDPGRYGVPDGANFSVYASDFSIRGAGEEPVRFSILLGEVDNAEGGIGLLSVVELPGSVIDLDAFDVPESTPLENAAKLALGVGGLYHVDWNIFAYLKDRASRNSAVPVLEAVAAYDISVSGTAKGPYTVSIPVNGPVNEGDSLFVVHLESSGPEILLGRPSHGGTSAILPDVDGSVSTYTIITDQFSPFIVFKLSTEPAPPPTGDGASALPWALLLVALVCGAGARGLRKRKARS